MMRLLQFQVNNLITIPIFDYTVSNAAMISAPPYSNFNYDCLRAARRVGINIRLPRHLYQQFTITGHGPLITDALKDISIAAGSDKLPIPLFLTQISRLGIFFISDLLDITGRNLLSWKQLCHLSNRSARGRVPLWF